MNWPIGDGEWFQGVLDRQTKQVHLFQRGDRRKKVTATVVDVDHPDLEEIIGKLVCCSWMLADLYCAGEQYFAKLKEDMELLDNAMPPPDLARIEAGDQSPLFFGSAMTNFGVELFLKTFLEYARHPVGREATIQSDSSDAGCLQIIEPTFDDFSGFVFKLQANLDPKHRDRMAFIRICSGTFRKGMKVQHSRMKKAINLSSAQSLFAQDRESILEAYPGDVIGIHNPGHFAIGDTIYSGEQSPLV